MNDKQTEALKLAAQGYRVFPLHWIVPGGNCSCHNQKCNKSKKRGKHPLTANGFKDATTDPKKITEWWTKWPNANIGIPTGSDAGIVVFDCDDAAAVEEVKNRAKAVDFRNNVPTVKTGRKGTADSPEVGYHFIFAYPSGISIKSRAGILPKLDVKADDGYVVAPPSDHYSGEKYAWEKSLIDIKPPQLTRQLIDLLTANHQSTKDQGTIREPFDAAKAFQGIPEGKRHTELRRLASSCRGKGLPQEEAERMVTEAAEKCNPPYDEEDPSAIVEDVYRSYPPNINVNPWEKATPAPIFLAQEEAQFNGIAKDLLARGAITLISAPRGLGKSHVAHGLAVTLAKGGTFRDEQVKPARVLLIDRDNPLSVIKERLFKWEANQTNNLQILTRTSAPPLTDRRPWSKFPADQYDVIIIDSYGSFTEGVTEKEGKETTEVLATLLSIARQDVAVLVLHNTTKDGASSRGRGEIEDRVDILYEARDATGFTPSGKKPWYEELPEGGAGAHAARATRRKGRTAQRLAFIPSKFRIAQEPEPFCLEIDLPEGEAWTLTDVTPQLLTASKEAAESAKQEEQEKIEQAAEALQANVINHETQGNPLVKSKAEDFLRTQGLNQTQARQLIKAKIGVLWDERKLDIPRGSTRGKRPIALFSIPVARWTSPSSTKNTDKENTSHNPIVDNSVDSAPQNKSLLN